MDHSTAMTRAGGRTGKGTQMGQCSLGARRGSGGKLASGLTTTKPTTGRARKSKPVMTADTPSENSNPRIEYTELLFHKYSERKQS